MVSQPIYLGLLVVGSGSIDLLLLETLIEFRVGGLGSYPLSSHSQMRLSWAVSMSFDTKVN
jgi:hypothetical protein